MESESEWVETDNVFENVTEGSRRKMNMLGSDHVNKLKAGSGDPGILAIYNLFKPGWLKWRNVYKKQRLAEINYHSSTFVVNKKLAVLVGDFLNDLEAHFTIALLPDDQVAFDKLLPEGRAPFYDGSREDRVAALNVLKDQVLADSRLAAVHSKIINFNNELEAAGEAQDGNLTLLKGLADDAEAGRIELADELYRSLGLLKAHYYKTRHKIQNYFDLSLLKTRKPGDPEIVDEPTVTLELNAGATVDSGLSIEPETPMRIRNVGAAALRVCMSHTAGISCDPSTPSGAAGFLLNPGEEKETSPALLGLPEGGYLNITNMHPSIKGSVEVYLI